MESTVSPHSTSTVTQNEEVYSMSSLPDLQIFRSQRLVELALEEALSFTNSNEMFYAT